MAKSAEDAWNEREKRKLAKIQASKEKIAKILRVDPKDMTEIISALRDIILGVL